MSIGLLISVIIQVAFCGAAVWYFCHVTRKWSKLADEIKEICDAAINEADA